ncbi:MAG: hypothetical protein J7K98_03275 [Candidatus Aenigmarchaeota archaeon]|nr:hypothetical protein [Candidatus Aenigmarchaeota archaeon]
MKGVIFTVDAMIAILMFSVLAAYLFNLSLLPIHPSEYSQLSYLSRDWMNALTTLTVDDVKNETIVSELIEKGIITDADLNKTVLDLVGSLWEAKNYSYATELSKQLIEPFANRTNKCVRLSIGNETIYSSCSSTPQTSSVSVSTRLQSGYELGKPVRGYIARAWATKTKKNNTLILKGDVITSSVRTPWGWNNGNVVNITYDLNIPLDAQIQDSYWFIESAWTDNVIRAYINDVYIPGSTSLGSVTLTGLNSYIHPGHNKLTVLTSFGYGGYEGGDDGASHFILTYSTTLPTTISQSNRFYFATVVSGCSIRYKKPVFVPGTVESITVNITLKASTATLRIVYDGQEYLVSTKNVVNNNVVWNSSEIESVLLANGISYSDLSSKYFWVVVDADTYNSREYLGDTRIIYNTSYVEVNTSSNTVVYGHIDITKVIPVYSYSTPLWGDFYRVVEWRFESIGTPLYVDSQLAWLYFSGSDPSQQVYANSKVLYSHPPQPLIIEFARYGYTNTSGEIVGGENSYKLEFGYGYGINPFHSLVDYTFLIPSQVGYGDVFSNPQDAIDDAKQRLLSLLEGSGISAEEIIVENKTVSGIRWLWGPSLFKIEVWEK